MQRRDISKALLATAAGSTLIPQRSEAQTCSAPCYAQTAAEATAGVTPASTWATPDGTDTLNVFRFMTSAQVADVLAGTQTLDVSGAIQAANDYLEGSATAHVGRKTAPTPGGTLYFPGGRYYCGTTGLRIGDMVEWRGNQFSAARLSWSNSFTGNGVTLGPDAAGFGDGRTGVYCMGSVIDNIQIDCGTNTAWGIYTVGAQQNCTIRNLWVTNVNRGGIFLQDHHGSTSIKVENVYLIGGAAMTSSVVGIHCDGPACIELNRISMNGNSQPLFRGIEYVSGGLLVTNFACEMAVTHIDIAGTADEHTVVINKASLNLASSGAQGIWIHSGYPGTICATGVGCGPYQVAIRNDVTGEQKAAQITGGIINYIWSGTVTDNSVFQNALIVPPVVQVNPPPTTTLNVESYSSYVVSIANITQITMAAPTIGSNPMPASGRTGQRILIRFRNISGGAVPSPVWDAVFKMTPFTAPTGAHSRAIEFEWNGSNWIQLWQGNVDVPN